MRMDELIDDLIEAAGHENWGYVDDNIPKICNNPNAQNTAVNLLESEEPNLRDLGASILARAKIDADRFSSIRKKLGLLLQDNHPYSRYRAAFALAEHGAGAYKSKMLTVLREARDDPDVGEIAKGYLKRLK